MNKSEVYKIPCPKCKVIGDQKAYSLITDNLRINHLRLANGKINFGLCDSCGNHFQIKTGLLVVNRELGASIYYHPVNHDQFNKELSEVERMLGPQSYLSKTLKYTDWDVFVAQVGNKCLRKYIVPEEYQVILQSVSRKFSGSGQYWTCSVCDGDHETGCLASDPDQCAKFR